jgi:hypothetical protein
VSGGRDPRFTLPVAFGPTVGPSTVAVNSYFAPAVLKRIQKPSSLLPEGVVAAKVFAQAASVLACTSPSAVTAPKVGKGGIEGVTSDDEPMHSSSLTGHFASVCL